MLEESSSKLPNFLKNNQNLSVLWAFKHFLMMLTFLDNLRVYNLSYSATIFKVSYLWQIFINFLKVRQFCKALSLYYSILTLLLQIHKHFAEIERVLWREFFKIIGNQIFCYKFSTCHNLAQSWSNFKKSGSFGFLSSSTIRFWNWLNLDKI